MSGRSTKDPFMAHNQQMLRRRWMRLAPRLLAAWQVIAPRFTAGGNYLWQWLCRGWALLAAPLYALWTIACLDLLRWRRSPLTIACSFIPPVGMTLFLIVLSLSVTQQPVALVVNGQGPQTEKMRGIIAEDTDAYYLSITDERSAQRMLQQLEVAAVITIPADFDAAVQRHAGIVELTLNNIDIDFADDIRRSVDRSVARFHEPKLTTKRVEGWDADDIPLSYTSTYGVMINEQDLRSTNVDWLNFQVIPALVLLVLCVGLIGTALLCSEDVERGTSRYLTLSPRRGWVLLAGRLLGGTLAALLALLPAIWLCSLTRIVAPPQGHWPALAAIFVATACCAAGLGVILGALIRSAMTVALASTVLSTYLFFLGGGFTTIAFLPAWLRAISAWVPMRYAIDGMRQALFYPELTGIKEDLLVLCATALATVVIGSLFVRRTWAR
jgi:ABC-2 type transport system permease protein